MSKRECCEEQLKAFVAAYPRKLETDVYMVFEPPLMTWNDFTLGDWPVSVVCGRVLVSQSYLGGDDTCFICVDE